MSSGATAHRVSCARGAAGASDLCRSEAVAGWQLLHPLPLAGVLLILGNDLWLKVHHPGWWSGKLSDLGICALLPAVVASGLEWLLFAAAALSGRRELRSLRRGRWLPVVACAVAALYLALLQLSPSFVVLHRGVLSALLPGLEPRITMDPSDCLALPVVVAAYLQLERHRRRTGGATCAADGPAAEALARSDRRG